MGYGDATARVSSWYFKNSCDITKIVFEFKREELEKSFREKNRGGEGQKL